MPVRRALLVINRNSRRGQDELEAALNIFKQHDIQVAIEYPERPQDISSCIHRHAQQIDQVILGGGDGTMNAAAEALVAHKLPFGLLPMGTANDLARTLGIPTVLNEAAIVIAQGRSRCIDLGCVNGVYFFNVANIGLGVQVKHELTAESKQRWGIFSYAKGLLSAFKKNHPFSATITCDGRRLKVHSIQIAIGNGRYYGGGMAVAENATIDDHLFSLYSIKPVSLWSLFKMMPALRAGQFHAVEPALLLHGQQIRIDTHKPMPVSMDGEIRTRTPASFTMMSDALHVFVPAAQQAAKESDNVDQERQASFT